VKGESGEGARRGATVLFPHAIKILSVTAEEYVQERIEREGGKGWTRITANRISVSSTGGSILRIHRGMSISEDTSVEQMLRLSVFQKNGSRTTAYLSATLLAAAEILTSIRMREDIVTVSRERHQKVLPCLPNLPNHSISPEGKHFH
jgi:hypothetical protein